MKLPVPSLFGKKDTSNYYLSLLLRDEKAVAVILQEIEGKLKIIGQGETTFSAPLETLPFEDLLDALDKTISKAEEMLPPSIETEKTVFGVKDTWVDDKKIKKDYLSILKKLCDALSLQPIGFMVISEAISHLVSQEEGAPLSGILAELHSAKATLTLFRAGKILEVHSAKIDDSIPKTVDRLLHHFTVDVLPSRIILYNGGHADELAQEFISHHWSKSIPFLHVPQISVLPAGFDGKAMVYGAAEQMGFSVLDSLGDLKPITLSGDEEPLEKKTHHKKEELSEKDKGEETKTKNDEPEEEEEKKEEKLSEEAPEIDDTVNADNFGFVMGQDITSVSPHHNKPLPSTHEQEDVPSHKDFHQPPIQQHDDERPQRSRTADSGSPFAAIAGLIAPIKAAFATISLPSNLPGLNSLPFGRRLLIVPVVLLLLIGLGIWYFMSLKATVTLHMQAKKIDESTTISIQTDTSNDLSQKILAAEEVETSVDGSVSIATSGKKEIGDKAKGSVTLYNSSDAKKTVPAGTVVTSSNDLDFVTDKDTVVASASGDIFSGTKPGTTQVSVTAKNIGNEYNLPSNTKFTVTGSSSLAAKNDSAFSGGSKKEVTVVAKKDIDTLTTNLTKELEGKAKDALQSKSSSGKSVLPVFTDVTISKKSTDFDIGEEAKKVTMKGTIVYTSLAYNESDLKELAEATIKGQYAQDLSLSEKGIQVQLEDVKADDKDVTAKLVMNAGLLPKLDENSIVTDLAGKSFTDASETLAKIPQVATADIVLSPNIPFLPKLLPRVSKNITVVVDTNE